MILQSLVNYYQAQCALDEAFPRYGFALANISYCLRLDAQGQLLDVVSLQTQVVKNKKTQLMPRSMQVPAPVKRSVNIAANFLWDNAVYLLGLDSKGNPQRSLQCFAAAQTLHHQLLDQVSHPSAQALLAFFDTWQPQQAANHPALAPYLEELHKGANLIFSFEGCWLQEEEALKQAWLASLQATEETITAPCLVCGQTLPVARLHPAIKGVRNAQSSGATLVSFNAEAYESFGHSQGMNAPVSDYAAFAYGTALNHLLADMRHRQTLGDATLVFWAENAQPAYAETFISLLAPPADPNDQLYTVFQQIINGENPPNLDLTVPFFVLGLASNASRLAVRLFLQDQFGQMLAHLQAHHQRMQLDHAPFEKEYPSLYELLRETVNPNARDQSANPLLSGALLRAILNDAPYPAAFVNAILLRIRAERKINRNRAGILKANLLQNYKNDPTIKEVVSVSLNDNTENTAYVLGRVFSLLAKIQREAIEGINTDLGDKYLDAACATPALVFPGLLKQTYHHLSKLIKQSKDDPDAQNDLQEPLNKKSKYGWQRLIDLKKLLEKLPAEPLPKHLNLQEQGLFLLGFYQQNQANFTKKKEEPENDRTDQKPL